MQAGALGLCLFAAAPPTLRAGPNGGVGTLPAVAGSGGAVPAAPGSAARAGAAPGATAAGGRARQAAATENPASTSVALRILRAGGSAADAAIAAALAAGVASPSSSGIGGGGFALAFDSTSASAVALDFRETAPASLDRGALDRRPLAPADRGHLVGVPGEIAGLEALHRRFGRRRWAELVAPAIELAERGFPVSPHLAAAVARMGGRLAVDAGLLALVEPGGHPLAAGARATHPDLARTLRAVATRGSAALARGSLAERIAAAARSAGGRLTASDLLAYRPEERPVLRCGWEGHEVLTFGPPSAGGLLLCQTLAMVSSGELGRLGAGTAATTHLLAEMARGAFADRARHVGDPAFTEVGVERLLAPGRLAARRRAISLERTHAIARFPLDEEGTHHLTLWDASDQVVSLTTTVNRPFGALLVVPGTGILLNDQLDDFARPAQAAEFGLRESPNRPRPGARPVSSMTPTVVLRDGRPVLALGGSGGSTIGTNVTQVLLGVLAFGRTPELAIAAPRFAIPLNGPSLQVEPGMPSALVQDLERRGERVVSEPGYGAVQAVVRTAGGLVAAADPRKHGAAAAE